MNDKIAVCDRCGKELSNFEGRTAGCTHASCGGTFIAVPTVEHEYVAGLRDNNGRSVEEE